NTELFIASFLRSDGLEQTGDDIGFGPLHVVAVFSRPKPCRVEHRACALQGVVAIPWICMSIDFTTARLEEIGYSPMALNRRDFLRLGTLLAAIREKNV